MLTQWQFDLPTAVLVVVIGLLYAVGLRRVRASGSAWPRSRVVAFAAGLVLLFVLGSSFLGVYSEVLFWVRATQNMLSLMVLPLLLALGAPVTLALAAAPQWLGRRLRALGRSRLLRVLTFPLVLTVLLIAPLIVLYLSPLYEVSLRHPLVAFAARLVLLGCGFLYFWTRLQLDPTPRAGTHLVSFAISLTEAMADAVLGIVLWQGPLVAAGFYDAVRRPWGPSEYIDQIAGAGVLWIGADVAGLPFLAVLFLRWMRADERHARVLDTQLEHAQSLETAPAAGLWWQDDEVLAQRFRRR